MAVDRTHPGCFAHGSRLFAVPSDSGFGVNETRASYVSASMARQRSTRPRIHWSSFVGGVLGGAFIDFSAWHTSGVTDPIALGMMFALGGAVGFATAIGIRDALVTRPVEEAPVRLPAVEIPLDIARAAPVDSTADELVLWSVLTHRFRAATAALESVPFDIGASSADLTPSADDPLSDGTDPAVATRGVTRSPASTRVDAELHYVTARHDFEPVAELLGLPIPR